MKHEALIILAEECAEVAQVTAKCQRFGLDRIRPDLGITNRQLLEREIGDVLALVEVLINSGVVCAENLHEASQKKLHKLQCWSTIPKQFLNKYQYD